MNDKSSSFQQAVNVGIIDGKRLAELYELDDGSIEFAATLVQDFVSQKEYFFSELDSSLREKNFSAVKQTVHKLKSSLGNIAAGRASIACSLIEKQVASRPPVDTVIVMVENLKMEISSFLNAIR